MPTGAHRPARGLASTLAAFVASVLVGVVAVLLPVGPASASNVVTPGNFTGYGFDQCTAPTQAAMDAWLSSSPYWAVGIYISGDSRYCTEQPNLTPAWVDTQLANGWRLLPITLGPQAWCTTRQRYLKQVRISPDDTDGYAKARAQGRAEASKTVSAAEALGMAARSTMWYDIEAFDISRTQRRPLLSKERPRIVVKPFASQRAIVTFCWLPPESRRTWRPARVSICSVRSAS